MTKEQDQALRQQLIQALRGDQSHIDFQSAVDDFSWELAGSKPEGMPHTAWQLLEHMRIALHDILEFSKDGSHKSPKWPEGYWPAKDAPASEQAWLNSVEAYKKHAVEMERMVSDRAQDLFKPIEGGSGQTLLREVLVAANHGSYHLGQLMLLKKALLPAV